MSRRWLLSLLCLAVLFFLSVQFTGARGELRVNEAGSRILFEKDPAEVFLEVENPSLASVNANVHIELLDPRDRVIAKTTQVQPIARGNQTLKFALPFAFPRGDTRLLLYRLHYRVTPQDSPQEAIADGIISLSEMTSDIFELRVSGAAIVREGDGYRVRVQAVHPITQEPASSVHVDAQVTLDRDSARIVKLDSSRVTDAKGRAVLDFQLSPRAPKVHSPSSGELKVTGTKGAIVAETTGEVLVDQMARILINTDKPLYQPGQVMHVRALLQSPSRRALANEETHFKISDPDGAVLYRAVVTSSRFGIASIDWTIPENTRLGEFRISVGSEGGDDETSHYVRISRYELPNFKVNVDTDRKFYLPGQDATVTVRADYLFGQPVLRGNVRVVRESERRWNYREQKWELREESEQKGETKPDGSFVAKLDLSSYHQDLAGSDYNRFEDISFAAYFTDPTTNRTEQRRFDVRVTKEQIHVYVVDTYEWSFSRNLPLKFYVSTFYADGTPARCKVNVAFTEDADDEDEVKKRVATVTTNRYGLAQITTRLPKEFEDERDIDVVLSASDSSGKKGSNTEDINLDGDRHLRVETPKTIYRRGEPISAEIIGTEPEETVVVDLAVETGLIRTERVRLRGGRALITFPYRSEFKNNVSVVAYPESAESRGAVAIRTVIYPYNSELDVKVRSSRDTYRPGEDAQLNFSVSSSRDRSEESALGVVVLDQAVVERFRTDQEFGGGYALDYAIQRFLGLENQIGGISLRDLQRLNTSQPIPPEMDMVAAVLLRNSANYIPEFYSGDEFEQNAERLFGDTMKKQLSPVKTALSNHYVRTMKYPENEKDLRDSLSQSGIDFNAVRDPWGMPYRATFFVDKQADTLRFLSSGPDKRFETDDDFAVDRMGWAYFRPLGEAIERAITRYHERTGKYIRNAATLRDEVLPEGINLDQTYDRWGQPYRLDFEVEGSSYVLRIRSSGPDKQFAIPGQYTQDDFVIWQSSIDYFAEARAQINNALTASFHQTNKFPQSDQELAQALKGMDRSFHDLRDPWGRPYYNTFSTQSVFTDRVQLENRANFGQNASLKTNVTPVTQTLGYVVMRSVGADAQPATLDDFPVATFTVVISEQPRGAPTPVVFTSGIVLTGPNGAIMGSVMDPNGAAIPGVTVKATRLPTGPTTETVTDENGRYSFSSLAPGSYELTFDAVAFVRGVISQIVVRPQNITEVNMTLEVGAVTETVSVSAAESPMMTNQATVGVTERRVKELPAIAAKAPKQQISTPRLREYFPETLLWQPSIETDKQGRAQVNFKLADNITTWKVMVIGSTEDGRIGTTEKEIKAFQPFFVEHDPPRVLTEGDEISLPIVIRNYLSQPQKVGLEIKPESWFALLGPAQKQTNVVAGDAIRETFDFRVIGSVKDGKQRITARGTDEQDAIEKPVSVHPDGLEMSVTAGDLLDDATALNLDIAENVIPNSSRGELKIYPNLLSHVVDGVEGIMQRPYGCGEQTISSTYPSLLLLRHFKKRGEGFALSTRATRYLKDGYSRLLNYRHEDGGFTYWGYGEADLALTAYALQFLNDAGELIEVDQDVVKQAREWLVKQQQPNGSWRPSYWKEGDSPGPNIVLTAYVSRVLARTDAGVSEPLKRALNFLEKESQGIAEPYLLASYALAATDAKDTARAKPAVEKLRTLGLEEGNTLYWAIETNTPFYGWGRAGRIETTALVIQALARDCDSQTVACEANKKLINRGLLFLLKEKDRYGVWCSTQATVNVLDAMLVLFSHGGPSDPLSQSTADVVVNGNRMQTVQLDHRLNNPVTVNITEFLKAGKNSVELKRLDGLPFASVQAVANYYVPWAEMKPANNHSTSDLRLQVNFDKTAAKINEDVTCRVEAGRVGFRGYGMLLAEIGIPPGAEVDRSSLEKASKDWTINRYDVLPDRVVFYLWPKAGGVSFDFKFRPRFGLKAKNSASILYDYYNPEATVVVAPSLFTVR